MNSLRLYFRYIGISIGSQMQYPGSFAMQATGHMLTTGVEFLALWAMFTRFGSIRGWALPEVAILYGLANVSFAVADSMARGFDLFGRMLQAGDFDRLLLRPRGTVLQLAGEQLTLRRVGRFAQAAAVFAWGASQLPVQWTLAKAGLLIATIAGSVCLYGGLVILQATLAFWTTEALEVMNTFTYGGVFASQYPLPAYEEWFQKLLTYVVPIACVTYYPALALMGRADPLGSSVAAQWMGPLAGFLFFAIALQAWKVGVRHYASTGS